MIRKIRCEIENCLYSEADITSNQVAKLIDSKKFENKNYEINRKCYDELDSLVNKLIKIKQLDLALLLSESQFHLIKPSYTAQEKLKKLENLGILLTEISTNFHSNYDPKKIKECYSLYDEILNYMLSINDVDLKDKTKSLAWFILFYATSCDFMQDFTKSVDILPMVMFLMKTNFGDDAANHHVYAYCHHNYGFDLYATNRLIEAKQTFEEALKIYEKVSDWPNEQQKIYNTLLTTRVLDEVNTRLKSNNSSMFFRLIHLCQRS